MGMVGWGMGMVPPSGISIDERRDFFSKEGYIYIYVGMVDELYLVIRVNKNSLKIFTLQDRRCILIFTPPKKLL